MTTRWQNLRERMRSSLWLLPALLAIGAAGFAEVSLRLDAWIVDRDWSIPFLYPGGLAGAREVLSTLAGSMVSLTTISFSVMMVVLTLASNQFGPRVLRNFISDRFYQVVLGVFVATFAFSLLLLGRLPEPEATNAAVPRLAVTLALVLAFGCLATLIGFIHHVARSIQASQIVLRAHQEACRTIEALYPEELGHEGNDSDDDAEALRQAPARFTLESDRPGYIQALSVDELMTLARRHDCVVELLVKPGHFISTGTPLARIHGDTTATATDFESQLRRAIILGAERTGEQDAQYGVRQLMEIAIRSLSPGINDPVTAIACIDYLGENLLSLARRQLPGRDRCDDAGQLRVIVRRDDFSEIAAAAFDNLRHYGRGHPEVMNRLAGMIATLAPALHRAADRKWLDRALTDLRREAEHLVAPVDRQRFERACAAAATAAETVPTH